MAEQQLTSAFGSSSNSSSMMSSKKYDVFLSFRGEDTRKNFTSHLDKALKQKKVETYIDERLKKGDEISQALIEAIEDSHVSIVVFSENYASSKWCLGELIKILECKERGQIVIPVFFNIDPSHVRKQTGSYEQAFAKHEGEPNCNKWKAALTEAADLAGWDSQNYRTDAELVEDIVGDVLRKLPPRYPNQRKGLVGIEEHCKQVESLLKIGPSEVRTLGIWGMGGIGKTTLANTLYDKLFREFEDSCFLENVSDKLENHSFDNSDLRKLRGKKALIVLDDVATLEQLEKSIVDYDLLGPGSRVIVTTRNRQIFSPEDEIYQVEELSSDHSLHLFCLTVFGEKQPKDGYEDLLRRVISYCKGIPLALKVLGASLRRRNKEAWESELRKLKKIPNMEIHEVLKLSYDGLDHSQKDIFLDIACFFKGEERDWVTGILEAFDFFGASGIEVLLDKALITISDHNTIGMHDLIREMGREIVRQECIKDPGRQSRLWRHEEVHNVLKYNRGTDVVEVIVLDLRKLTGDLYLSSDSLSKMTNLRFLQIYGWACDHALCLPTGLESLSDKLRYLYWDECCLEYLPSNFCAEQLVELYMRRSKLKKLWDGVQNLVNLKIIDLEDSRDLIEIPDLSKAEKLEILSLSGCKSLHQLNVHSKSLRILLVNGCSSLKEFSVTTEEMTELNLAHTAVCALPASIWRMRKKPIFLFLRGCNYLVINMDNILDLWSLQVLDQSGTNIESLPALPPLNGCNNLGFVGNNIVHLSSLEVLDLSGTSIESLPALPPSLQWLMAINCTSLGTDLAHLTLQHMLQSCIPYLHQQDPNNHAYINGRFRYFCFPGDHVTDQCGFRTANSSVTIPYLPKSDLCGFIYCIILSKEVESSKYWPPGHVSCSIDQDHIHVGWDSKMTYFANLISDHVLFWYHEVITFDRISEVHDHFSNITFEFEYEYLFDSNSSSIKECGVFPVYATASGFKLVSSSSKEIFEWESITQISNNESQPRAIGVGGSDNEYEEDREQLLPTAKRTSP